MSVAGSFRATAVGAMMAAAMGLAFCGARAQDDPNTRRDDRRDSQNIDEPALFPMFGPRRSTVEDEEDRETHFDSSDPTYDESRVRPLRGFTGILTFLTPDDTDLSIGVGPIIRPDYFGSDNYEVDVDPQVYVRIRNLEFIDDDGADIALLGFSNFRFGPSIRLRGRRDEDENSALQGLGDVGLTFEAGGFAAATFVDRYSVKFKVRKGVATGHRGLIVDAYGTALLFRYGPLSTSITAQASWIGNDFADAYFSVTPEQSAASGLPVFDADSGFRNIGGSLNGYINLGERWSINPYISYDYIIGDIGKTPIIDDRGNRSQVRAGFHLIRQFKLF